MEMFDFCVNVNMQAFTDALNTHALCFPNIRQTDKISMALIRQCLFCAYIEYPVPVRQCSDTLQTEYQM